MLVNAKKYKSDKKTKEIDLDETINNQIFLNDSQSLNETNDSQSLNDHLDTQCESKEPIDVLFEKMSLKTSDHFQKRLNTRHHGSCKKSEKSPNIVYQHNQPRDKYIESFGIILFTRCSPNIKYLLVQRRDSYEYMDFITGVWKNTNDIHTLFSMMSTDEKNRLANFTFDEIWEDLFLDKTSFYYRECYEKSKNKYSQVQDRIQDFIDHCSNIKTEPPWGFAKGKKDSNEKPLNCALREFTEETRIDSSLIKLFSNKYVSEYYLGNNGKKYCTHYYIAEIENETPITFVPSTGIRDQTISDEIGNMGWFTLEEALNKLSLISRQKLLTRVNMTILNTRV